MKTISLKQVFDSIDYTPAPLPPVESHVMDIDQAHKIISRFAADDGAVFNFLNFYKSSCYLPIPMRPFMAMGLFDRYVSSPHPQFEIPLSPKNLKFTPEDVSGYVRTQSFIKLLQTALRCRHKIEEADSPCSPEVVNMLNAFSKAVDYHKEQGLNLSDGHFDQIKNLVLPANPADPLLGTPDCLEKAYASHFEAETELRKDRGLTKDQICQLSKLSRMVR